MMGQWVRRILLGGIVLLVVAIVVLMSVLLTMSPYTPTGSYHQRQAGETAPGLAGRISEIQGVVIARQPAGIDRVLARNSPVFEGDTVASRGHAAFKLYFTDETELSAGEHSRITIKGYVYQRDPEKENQCRLDVGNGSFRIGAGKVALGGPGGFQITTPLTVVSLSQCQLRLGVGDAEETIQVIAVSDGSCVNVRMAQLTDAEKKTVQGQFMEIGRPGMLVIASRSEGLRMRPAPDKGATATLP